jgi:hypothetical protein
MYHLIPPPFIQYRPSVLDPLARRNQSHPTPARADLATVGSPGTDAILSPTPPTTPYRGSPRFLMSGPTSKALGAARSLCAMVVAGKAPTFSPSSSPRRTECFPMRNTTCGGHRRAPRKLAASGSRRRCASRSLPSFVGPRTSTTSTL